VVKFVAELWFSLACAIRSFCSLTDVDILSFHDIYDIFFVRWLFLDWHVYFLKFFFVDDFNLLGSRQNTVISCTSENIFKNQLSFLCIKRVGIICILAYYTICIIVLNKIYIILIY